MDFSFFSLYFFVTFFHNVLSDSETVGNHHHHRFQCIQPSSSFSSLISTLPTSSTVVPFRVLPFLVFSLVLFFPTNKFDNAHLLFPLIILISSYQGRGTLFSVLHFLSRQGGMPRYWTHDTCPPGPFSIFWNPFGILPWNLLAFVLLGFFEYRIHPSFLDAAKFRENKDKSESVGSCGFCKWDLD